MSLTTTTVPVNRRQIMFDSNSPSGTFQKSRNKKDVAPGSSVAPPGGDCLNRHWAILGQHFWVRPAGGGGEECLRQVSVSLHFAGHL